MAKVLKINEVAKFTGVTVRTLHYYDEIDLLKPSMITDSGYRLYDEDALATLQEILFFRELEFGLSDIKEIMTSPSYNKTEALQKHKELLLLKRNRIDELIHLVDSTIKGDSNMSFKEFDNTILEQTKEKYAAEVKKRWGTSDAYIQYEEKTKDYGKDQWMLVGKEGTSIIQKFAAHRTQPANSDVVQALVKEWQDYITARFYNCSNEILQCLGLMYIEDERFRDNIDKCGMGTAQFMSDAIGIYCLK